MLLLPRPNSLLPIPRARQFNPTEQRRTTERDEANGRSLDPGPGDNGRLFQESASFLVLVLTCAQHRVLF